MMKKIKIAADSKIPFLKGALDHAADVTYYDPSEMTHEAVKDKDALIIRTRNHCNHDLLSGTNVKFIATATIGYDHIDTEYCSQNNIKWVNAPGCNSSSVMQYIASSLVTITEKRNLDLTKSTIGIVGVGNVGSKVARLAGALGMNVLLNDPPRAEKEGPDGFVSLDQIIEKSDIITFHVPLIKSGPYKTYHMAGEEFFAKFNGSRTLINSSRGPVVETEALKNAIASGKVNFCVLDVWEKEPNIDIELLKVVNIATPHIAGYSADGKANGTAECVRRVSEFFGLGIDAEWYPSDIPAPEGPAELSFDTSCQGNDILLKAIKSTYDVMRDDAVLRISPETFERQRGKYPVRREFPYYTVHMENSDPEVRERLEKIGFRL